MSRLLSLGLLAAVASHPLSAVAQTPTTDYVRLYDQVAATVAENFYDPALHGVDWTRAVRAHRTRAVVVRSDSEFLVLGRTLLDELHSSHLDLSPPAAGTARGIGIGARLRVIDGVLTVTEVSDLSDAARKGLRPGDQILTPDALRGPAGSHAELGAKTCDGAELRLSVRREAAFWPPEAPTFRWRVLNGGPGRRIGYLRVDGFGDDGAQLADQAMSDLADTDGLILDIRENQGGNASALRLASYFTAEPAPAVILLSRQFLAGLGRTPTPTDAMSAPKVIGAYTTEGVFSALSAHGGAAALWTEDLGDRRYTRPLYVLQGEETGSAAEGFAWALRLMTDATLIGRPTAGALLSAQTFDLGQGWSMRVPVQGIWAPDGENYGDRAVPPHVDVTWTRADLCKQNDPDLGRALELFDRRSTG